MDYKKFCSILNKHIFEGEKRELLKNIAERPERFIGLFRPTKPGAKILQHILQSHEIRFGDAFEELIGEILRELDFSILNKSIVGENGDSLSLDQYYEGKGVYYFIEQKVRDDHDSTKKRGQISNFETKLETLYKKHKDKLVGIMYFIDPDLSKNKNYYLPELKRLSEFYGVNTHLLYGKELFDYLGKPDLWEQILSWLKQWKDSLPEIPEIDFDKTPEESFEEIKELPIRYWRKLLENEKLWTEGIIKAIFRKGDTLKLILDDFKKKGDKPYQELEELLEKLLITFYAKNYIQN
jgi:hypothetical protein